MGLFDYSKAARKYQSNDHVTETLRRLRLFDEFHCLRSSNLLVGGAAGDKLPHENPQYIGWMTVCNGGLLFDTTLLSVTEVDDTLNLGFATLDMYNCEENRHDDHLPEGYYIIGLRSYGDPICLSTHDQKVYLWDCEQQEFTTVWEDFFNFLADEVDTAIELIANEDLDPIPLKLEGGNEA